MVAGILTSGILTSGISTLISGISTFSYPAPSTTRPSSMMTEQVSSVATRVPMT